MENHTFAVLFLFIPYISLLSRNNNVFIRFILKGIPYKLGNMKKTKDPDSILLGRRIRTLRTVKGLTQQELGNKADVDYKFVGEIERGNMNPSFKVLVKISRVLDIELPEILRFEQETSDSKELQNRITKILKDLPVEKLQNVLMLLRVLYPIR
jgi:transcriptional regulator with XRE-family HTH domain